MSSGQRETERGRDKHKLNGYGVRPEFKLKREILQRFLLSVKECAGCISVAFSGCALTKGFSASAQKHRCFFASAYYVRGSDINAYKNNISVPLFKILFQSISYQCNGHDSVSLMDINIFHHCY